MPEPGNDGASGATGARRAKRKRSRSSPAAATPSLRAPSPPAAAPGNETTQRQLRRRGAERDAALRDQLVPLGPGERPTSLVVAIAVALVVAVAVIAAVISDHHLSRHGGSKYGGAFIAVLLVTLAAGMWRGRHWAVLSFEGLLAFQMVVTSLALIVASTVWAALLCMASVGLSGWLFWKLVRVMARLQAPDARVAADGP